MTALHLKSSGKHFDGRNNETGGLLGRCFLSLVLSLPTYRLLVTKLAAGLANDLAFAVVMIERRYRGLQQGSKRNI